MMLLGKTAPKIKKQAEELGFANCIMCKDMEECVNEAYKLAEKGDTVLLSPACASWDMYTCLSRQINYRQEGNNGRTQKEKFKKCEYEAG